MAVVRIEALTGLGAAIEAAVPSIAGKICYGQAPASHQLEFPSVYIDPKAWRYDPHQAIEEFEPSATDLVVSVGSHTAEIRIRLGAATLFERYEMEQAVIDLFLGTPLKPGILLTEISTCVLLGDFTASWELVDDEWRDEQAFDSKYYSQIMILGTIPALVTRTGVYTIDQLQLGTDLTPTPNDGNLPDFTDVEIVQINDDGTTSPL